MSIQLIVDNVSVPIKQVKYSDGSSNIKLEVPQQLKDYPPSAYYAITVETTTPADSYLWEICLVLSAIEHTWPKVKFNRQILRLPYLPHARADRVFEEGNSFPLEMFLSAIYWMFDEITLIDPHSDYMYIEENIENDHTDEWESKYSVKFQHECFIDTVKDIQSGDILISPDKGALKKIYKLQKALDHRMIATTIVEASKTRDVDTGRIISTSLPEDVDLKGKVAYIVDDICDGGGTFLPLADKIKEAGAKEVHLYVTHGIFAKGLNVFKGIIDKIHCYQTVGTYVNAKDILDFNNGLEVK